MALCVLQIFQTRAWYGLLTILFKEDMEGDFDVNHGHEVIISVAEAQAAPVDVAMVASMAAGDRAHHRLGRTWSPPLALPDCKECQGRKNGPLKWITADASAVRQVDQVVGKVLVALRSEADARRLREAMWRSRANDGGRWADRVDRQALAVAREKKAGGEDWAELLVTITERSYPCVLC